MREIRASIEKGSFLRLKKEWIGVKQAP